jgi:lysyl-tRNA synthetase class 2
MERVYEINRNFRNEGVSSMHNPEFTMLEFYTAYFDCRDVMETTEALVAEAAARVSGGTTVTYKGREVSFRTPFARVRMVDAVARALGAEPAQVEGPEALRDLVGGEAFRARAAARGLDPAAYADLSHGRRLARLFEDLVEESLWQPTFVVDYPIEISPLSKARADDPRVADRFELFAACMEVANGFSELNDPLEQRQRFLDQLAQREKGDLEAHQMDEDYVRALGHGLPPTGGCGVGVDRLAMILTDSPSIRDVILFPHMRPEGGR